MSDYQRFVSYLYEYKNNIKSKNCGFCRVELRDHNCRLEVHLKIPHYPFTPTLKVYGFVPSKEKLYGIFLGNASYQQGNVSGTFSFSERNIKDSSYQFSQLGGIFIKTDSDLCFASAWKNLNIHPEHFMLPESKSLHTNASTKEFTPELSLPNPNTKIPMDEPQSESSQPDITDTPSISTEIEIISESESTEEEQITQEPEIPVEPEISTPSPIEQTSNLINDVQTDEKIENTTTESSTETSSVQDPEPSLLAASMDSDSIAQEPSRQNFWEEILKSYPQCHPFFDDEIHNCVQISPKDVQKISASGFQISNNAFFKHNCQSFQHFLLGKKHCEATQTQYILAVPGIYTPREQYMASMFGFPYFKPSQNSHCRNNCWGYWYRIIPEHWNECRF